jgi:hypothetical protein
MTPSEQPSGGDVLRAPRTRRLVDLLHMQVRGPDGRVLGRVNDLRLAPTRAVRGVSAELVVVGIVVDGNHPGSLLGYDRRSDQGPWLVRVVVRALHRNAGYLPWEAVTEVDWDAGRVTVSTDRLEALSGIE